MSEEFVRFTLEPEVAAVTARSFSDDFGEAPPRESRGPPRVQGEGGGVAGEERPREAGAIPQGGFAPNGPSPLVAFFSERPLAGAERVISEPSLGAEVARVEQPSLGVAGEEEAGRWGEMPSGGRAPRGPAPRGVFRPESVPRCEDHRSAREPEHVCVASVRCSAPGVAGESGAKEATVERPHSFVEEPTVLEGDVDRMERKPRRRRRRGKKLPI